jgi:hypothetical protein
MTDPQPDPQPFRRLNRQELELGGLRFDVSCTGDFGATMRVYGTVGGQWKEMLRFDDFVDGPHYHAPADGPQISFDRALGEPLAWYLSQIRDDLPDWLTRSGFAEVVPTIDMEAVAGNIGRLEEAMSECLPPGFTRVPGVGLQRVATSSASPEAGRGE